VQEARKHPGLSSETSSDVAADRVSGAGQLIKPYIPSERVSSESRMESRVSEPVQATSASSPVVEETGAEVAPKVEPPPVPEASATKRQWEDQQVRAAAIELARSYSGIHKLKLCFAVKEDEWWATLYESAGNAFELKRYTWNREQEKFQPFLVPKRINGERLQASLGEQEPDMACEVIDPTPTEQ
jgi:cytoskeletal protein RodZ